MIWVDDARRGDGKLLDVTARTVDRQEWAIASGMRLGPAVELCIERADGLSRIMFDCGDPLCIWGAGPTEDPRVGSAWLVGTDLGQEMAHRVQRHWAVGVGELHQRYPVLTAEAWDRNTLHHHWLLRLGFVDTGQRRVLGLGGVFMLFRREDSRVYRRRA